MSNENKTINQVINSIVDNLSEEDKKSMIEETEHSNQPLFTQVTPLRMIAYEDMNNEKGF